jgi:hypothetical protein
MSAAIFGRINAAAALIFAGTDLEATDACGYGTRSSQCARAAAAARTAETCAPHGSPCSLTGRLTAADHARVLGRTAEYAEAVRKVRPGAALFLLHAHGLVGARA